MGYIMEGEWEVDYGPINGKRLYKAGEAFLEALNSAHSGPNPSHDVSYVLLAVYLMGGVGVPLSQLVPKKCALAVEGNGDHNHCQRILREQK